MKFLLLTLKILSTIRSTILLVTIIILIQGIFGIHILSISMWIKLCILFTFIHMISETIRYKYIKDTKIITTLFLTLFWLGFIESTNLYIFMINDFYQVQTLINTITVSILSIYLFQNLKRNFEIFAKIKIGSRLLITLSFLLVITVGTVLLMLPLSSTYDTAPLSLIDAFFTAVSAVSVTGLIVVDTAIYFSRFGQIVILCLIQIGALGLVTITTTLMSLVGKKLSLTGQISAKDSVGVVGDDSLAGYLTFTLGFTILVELIVTLCLFPQFYKILPLNDAIFYAIFHAISSFCNAGFALFTDSLMGFRNNIVINLSIMISIIIGGLGFGIWFDLKSRFIDKDTKTLSLHALIALRISTLLIVIGAIGFFFFEQHRSLAGLPLNEQILGSLFASVNLRTAGFNTVDLSITSESSRFFSLILMYIGASPGSTGGGIKTTSFMVLCAAVYASIRNSSDTVIYGKRIEESLIRQAWTLAFYSLIWIFCVTLALCTLNDIPLSEAVYETFSAYGTVGVSVGITSSLSDLSKILIAITMLLGRIGPTTIMLALIGRSMKPSLIRTPTEKLPIG